jgi:hypothetical protein
MVEISQQLYIIKIRYQSIKILLHFVIHGYLAACKPHCIKKDHSHFSHPHICDQKAVCAIYSRPNEKSLSWNPPDLTIKMSFLWETGQPYVASIGIKE